MPELPDLHELETRLTALARDIEWPIAPALVLPAVPRASGRFRLAPRRRTMALVLAAAVLALGVALAVPGARSAILDWLQLGAVRIERVETSGTVPEVRSTPASAASSDAARRGGSSASSSGCPAPGRAAHCMPGVASCRSSSRARPALSC